MNLYTKKEMNQERKIFAIAYDNKNKDIFVFGGYANVNLKRCEKYSIINNEWTQIASLRIKKSNASAGILNNQLIYVIGG